MALLLIAGFEYAGIMERNKQNPTRFPLHAQNHVCNIEDILNTIIHPLRNYNGIEALRGIIDYTAVELRNGSLRNVREVEVSLISNGEVSTRPITLLRAPLTDYSHPACPYRSIRDMLTPLPVLVITL